jgi:hypothetical protein
MIIENRPQPLRCLENVFDAPGPKHPCLSWRYKNMVFWKHVTEKKFWCNGHSIIHEHVSCPRKTDREKSISEYCTMDNQLLLYLYTHQFCTDSYALIEPFNIKGEWIIFTKANSKCKLFRGNTCDEPAML